MDVIEDQNEHEHDVGRMILHSAMEVGMCFECGNLAFESASLRLGRS